MRGTAAAPSRALAALRVTVAARRGASATPPSHTASALGVVAASALPLLFALAPPPLLAQDAYVPNQGSNTLTIFNTRNLLDITTLPLGNQPHEALMRLDGLYAFISNRLDNTLSVFDTATRTEVDTDGTASNGLTRLPAGSRPHGLALTPDDRYLFVTNDGSNSVTVIDAQLLRVVSTIAGVGQAPHMVAIRPDGEEAWVGNVSGGDVSLIDVRKAVTDPANALICVTPGGTGAACRIPAGSGTEGVAFTHDGRTAYAANGSANTVTVIDVATRSITRNLPVSGSPRRVHLRPDGLRAYVSKLFGSDVAVIDTATHLLVPGETITSVANGLGMDFRSDGGRLYVPNFFSSTVTIVHLPNTATRQSVSTGSNPDSVALQPEAVRKVRFAMDKITLLWDRQYLASRYNVYRASFGGLPDYGACVSPADPDPTDTSHADTDTPLPGEGFAYLVSIVHSGIEGTLGYATSGLPRRPASPCSLGAIAEDD